jgi:hypothetical protein
MAADPELLRLVAAMDEASRAKAAVWERVQRDPHDDAAWEEFDIWHREEARRHEAVHEYRRSRR